MSKYTLIKLSLIFVTIPLIHGLVFGKTDESRAYLVELKIMTMADTVSFIEQASELPVPVSPEQLNSLENTKGVTLESQPRVMTGSGAQSSASVRMISRLQYFEAQDNGSYVLKELPMEESPGTEFDFILTPITKDTVECAAHIRLSVMVKRQSLPNVAMDVGRPIMQRTELDTKLLVHLNQWVLLAKPLVRDEQSGQHEYIAIFGKVTLAPY